MSNRAKSANNDHTFIPSSASHDMKKLHYVPVRDQKADESGLQSGFALRLTPTNPSLQRQSSGVSGYLRSWGRSLRGTFGRFSRFVSGTARRTLRSVQRVLRRANLNRSIKLPRYRITLPKPKIRFKSPDEIFGKSHVDTFEIPYEKGEVYYKPIEVEYEDIPSTTVQTFQETFKRPTSTPPKKTTTTSSRIPLTTERSPTWRIDQLITRQRQRQNKDNKQEGHGYLRNTPRPLLVQNTINDHDKERDLKEVTRAWYSYYRKLKNFRKKYRRRKVLSRGDSEEEIIYVDGFTPSPPKSTIMSPPTSIPATRTTPTSIQDIIYSSQSAPRIMHS